MTSDVLVMAGLAVLIVVLIGGAVWMYGRQSARRRRPAETADLSTGATRSGRDDRVC